jgi:hypothetical protein
MLKGRFSQYDSQDLNRLAAKGILEKLRNIRQRINVEFTARRLIWELIQNAKDNAAICNIDQNPDVNITIELKENQLIFSHDKGYFTNENVRGLIRRYSSSEKDRKYDQPSEIFSTTGRFGTGFMTTHLLSEKVIVKGVFQDDDLMFRKFELPLDRTGHDEISIINSIENSFNSIDTSIEKSSKFSSSAKENFKTEFIYTLANSDDKLLGISISEVKETIAYTLINLPAIRRITIKENELAFDYEILRLNDIPLDGRILNVFELKTNDIKAPLRYFATIIDQDISIILPIHKNSDGFEIERLPKNLPKLFLDFPLIGTEDFNIPFIINSSRFEPTDSRDGISLTGGTDRDTLTNCLIIDKGFELFKLFTQFVSNQLTWRNIYNLARIKAPKEVEWIDKKWYNEHIILPIQDFLLKVPIVDLNSGKRISIKDADDKNNIFFPSASKIEIREKLWALTVELAPEKMPRRSDIHDWHEIIWDESTRLTLEILTKGIQNRAGLNKLSADLKKTEAETIGWLNKYYDLLNLEDKFIDEIALGKYKVIPNQNLEFKSKLELYADINIDNELKNVLQIFETDVRQILSLDGIILKNNYPESESKIILNEKDQSAIVDQINKYLKENHYNSAKAINYLLALYSNDTNFPHRRLKTYDFAKTLLSDIPEKRVINHWSETVWELADRVGVDLMVRKVAECKNLNQLQVLIRKVNKDETKVWLQSFISYLTEGKFHEKLNSRNTPILPDQNGYFKIKDDLFLDNYKIDDGIKDIAFELGSDIRAELLDKSIAIELPENRTRSERNIADVISKLVKTIWRDDRARIEKKDVIRKLYLWMNRNREIAEQIFGDVYEKRYLLVSDEEIAANIEKAEIIDEIIHQTDLSPKEIRDKFIEFVKNPGVFQLEFKGGDKLINDPNAVSELNDLLRSKNLTIEQLKLLIANIDADEDEMGILYSTSTHLPQNEKNIENEQARELVYERLNKEGFEFREGKGSNSVVNGVFKENVEYPLVVKSYKNNASKFNIRPNEWIQLSKPNSMFWVHRGAGKLEVLTLEGLLKANSDFHVQFETETFSFEGLVEFAKIFRLVKNVHFQLDAPNFSMADLLDSYGFNVRKSDIKAIGSDNVNLLH